MPYTRTLYPEDRNFAAIAHLSGLAGYLVPMGGVIVPIILIVTQTDRPVIRAIAKQALYLNLLVYFQVVLFIVLWFTVIFIPIAIVLGIILGITGIVAIVLPILGAIKALDGEYFRYPLVGQTP